MLVRHHRGLHVGVEAQWYGGRGLFFGGDVGQGWNSSVQQVFIDYITIQTTGNATNFGNLTHSRGMKGMSGTSDGTRGLMMGGGPQSYGQGDKTIDYVTIATTGNATNFGNMTVARDKYCSGACSDGTLGVMAGGQDRTGSNDSGQGTNNVELEVIDYVTIATTGNATDFGNLTAGRSFGAAAASDGIYGIFAGGYGQFNNYYTDIMDYITIATTGNATNFGDLTSEKCQTSGTGDATRYIFAGGKGNWGSTIFKQIDYGNFATPANASDFGDLTTTGGLEPELGDGGSFSPGAVTDLSRACFGGSHGETSNGWYDSNHIDYITIATTGNATDFGTMTHSTYDHGKHGGCAGG